MLRIIPSIVLLLLLSACGDTDNAEPPAELVEFEPALEVEELWSVNTGDGVDQQFLKLYPLVLEDRIVITDRNGRVSAYNIKNGNELWNIELEEPVSGGVGGNKDNYVITTRNGNVILLDNKGKKVWSVDASSEILMPAQIVASRVIIRSVDGQISALDIDNGATIWTYRRDVPALSLRGNSMPLIKQSYLFTGLDNGRLVVLDLIDGHIVFDIAISSPSGRSELERLVDIDGDSVIHDDILYMASYQGRVVALDIKQGQLRWNRTLSTYSGVELVSSGLVLADDRDHIWSLDARNGATLWKQDKLSARVLTRPVATGDMIVTADYEGYLHWLSAFDGRFLARIATDGSGIITPPQWINGILYVLTRDGELNAYRIKPIEAGE